MTNRPTSITVIGWVLIVLGVLSIAGEFARSIGLRSSQIMAHSQMPIPIQVALSLTGGLVNLMCGYSLLRAKNWARYVCVCWAAFQIVLGWVTSPIKLPMIPSIFLFLLATYILFRPRYRTFFEGTGAKAITQPRKSARQILSICCYVVTGFLLSSNALVAFTSAPNGGTNPVVNTMAKWTVLALLLGPPLVFLLIGCSLSLDGKWKRDIGIVLTASAAGGCLMITTLMLLYMDSEFQKTLPPEKVWSFGDYTTGIIWLASEGALGVLLLFVAQLPPD